MISAGRRDDAAGGTSVWGAKNPPGHNEESDQKGYERTVTRFDYLLTSVVLSSDLAGEPESLEEVVPLWIELPVPP